jgi:hypothetical protein
VPDWVAVFDRAWERFVSEGRFAIFDCHADTRSGKTRTVELVARAELSRRVWEPLEQRAHDFTLDHLDGDPDTFGGRLFLATGTKPTESAP